MALRPPGGASTRVVARSEMKLPLFWLPLEAQALEDTEPLLTVLVVPVGAEMFEVVFSETARVLLLAWWAKRSSAAAGSPKEMEEWPPGGACRRVEERSEMKLPLFWLSLRAQVLEEGAAVCAPPISPKEIWLLPPGVAPVLLKRDIVVVVVGVKRIR